MNTATDSKIVNAVVEFAMRGEIDVPQDNDFGGADLWKPGQLGVKIISGSGERYVAEGVRIAIDDNQINLYKFERSGLSRTIKMSDTCSEAFLIAAIQELL
jgi:hypothetical protein